MYQSLFHELSVSANYELHLLNGRDKFIYKKIKVVYNLVRGRKASNFLTRRTANLDKT